jgi:2-oxoglutarate dehydrogenase E1 component
VSDPHSFLQMINVKEMEHLFAQYQRAPDSVDPSWRYFFEGMLFAGQLTAAPSVTNKDFYTYLLIDAYRKYGHLETALNPIEEPPQENALLKLENFGLSQKDLQEQVATYGLLLQERAPLQEVIARLKTVYCGRMGVEYMHLSDPSQREWIRSRIESTAGTFCFSGEVKKEILVQLNRAEIFETFIHTRYVGQKRFSLEGLETLIPVLAHLVNLSGDYAYQELLIGMAHRGRLNVLTNILKKSYTDVFSEFEDYQEEGEVEGDGDVKYHKGFSSSVKTLYGNPINLSLTSNPSHLESVNPVLLGKTRAKQEAYGDSEGHKYIPINIHGDSAVAGQGVVYETLQLQKIEGYSTGGTIHIVANNQIGFTTLPHEYRSTHYSTDVGKGFQMPIFHVNAEDPESCIFATTLAFEMRHKFGCDVFVELNGYRKFGHNETDEPSFTQPVQYQTIKKKKTIRKLYVEQLSHEGSVEQEIAKKLENSFKEELDYSLNHLKINPTKAHDKSFGEVWEGLKPPKQSEIFLPCKTAVDQKTLETILQKGQQIPEGFTVHPKIQKVLKEREEKFAAHIDWALGEFLAFGSLLLDGKGVRLAGQDCQRGTFSHRHAVWVDQKSAKRYFPLQHLSEKQGPFFVYNSILSEFGVLGFEFGYSLSAPHHLVLWEAQFGDFANGAQIIIDQYLTASGSKWSRYSGIVLLLPHGYEGQGAEHSSARLERYLQLAGSLNLQVANLTTPAQYFHVLRRQLLRPFRYPLVLMTPKMLLRHPECVSSVDELANGCFQEILDDSKIPKAKRLIFCTGKVYFDLLAARSEKGIEDEVALIRVEQLFPFHAERMQEILKGYQAKEYVWVQEEPENMGAWSYIMPFLQPLLDQKLHYVARKRGSATATGSHKRHQKEQQDLLERAFGTL